MSVVKLSKPQLDTLQWALSKLKRKRYYGPMEGEWFYPQFTTKGSIEHFCRPQTCKALLNKGFLEYRNTPYWNGTRHVDFFEYRITDEGKAYLQSKGLA